MDNVEARSAITDYLKPSCKGSVVFTTRYHELGSEFTSCLIQVPVLSDGEAQDFLLKRLYRSNVPEYSEGSSALAVALKLGKLPLALDLIASYVTATNKSYRCFLQDYPDFDHRLLFDQQGLQSVVKAYVSPIQSTWSLKPRNLSNNAKLLMHCLSIVEPDGIPTTVFRCSDIDSMCVLQIPHQETLFKAADN